MFLLEMAVGAYPGLGPNTSRSVESVIKQKEQTPFERESGTVADLVDNQAHIALQLYLVSSGQSLHELAKQAKVKGKQPTQPEIDALRKLNLLLTSGKESKYQYAGPTKIDEKKGTITIDKNILEKDTKELLSKYKTDLSTLHKSDPEKATILEGCAKAHNSLGLYYSGIFQAKKPEDSTKAAVKNLDGAVKGLGNEKGLLKLLNGKKELDKDLQRNLIVTLGVIQALINKSGTPITQGALLAQLKQAVDKHQPGAVDKYATQLITQAEEDAKPVLAPPPDQKTSQPAAQAAAHKP